MKVFITGANGFVGRAVALELAADENIKTRVAVRKPSNNFPARIEVCDNLDLGGADWSSALKNIDVVIHCAAHVHKMGLTSRGAIAEFRKINVDGTIRFARQAAASGVKRFIYLSSLKANGENTEKGKPFKAEHVENPIDPYGISKLEAEKALFELGKKSAIEIVIVRPPLIYGPGVKGNFLSMLRWLNRSIPLPLGWTENKRSLVAIENLVDFIKVCCFHPAAKNEVFLVSDGVDLSTTELLRSIAHALHRRTCLIPVPPAIIDFLARALGRGGLSQRLIGSLQVDIGKNKELLDWTPPIKPEVAMKRTAEHFLTNRPTST